MCVCVCMYVYTCLHIVLTTDIAQPSITENIIVLDKNTLYPQKCRNKADHLANDSYPELKSLTPLSVSSQF